MAQAADYNSTWAGAVRAAANRGQLSHAVILTGEGTSCPRPAILPRRTCAAVRGSVPACNAMPAAR